MGRYDGILICSDFDSTLFVRGKLSEENAEAIKYFQANGGLFTLVSGRHPEHFKQYYDLIRPNTYIMGLNGGALYDPDTEKRVYWGRLPEEAYSRALSMLDKYDRLDHIHIHREYDWFPITRENREEVEVDPTAISKIIFYVQREDSDYMKEALKGEFERDKYALERSWINGIELLSVNDTKGAGIRRMRELLGDRVHTVIGVGDYENDVTMIEESDIGYAVENACDELKAVADRITVHCENHAIAQIMSDL